MRSSNVGRRLLENCNVYNVVWNESVRIYVLNKVLVKGLLDSCNFSALVLLNRASQNNNIDGLFFLSEFYEIALQCLPSQWFFTRQKARRN